MNSSEVTVLLEEGKALLSEIFQWYQADFGGEGGVVDVLYDYLADGQSYRVLLGFHALDIVPLLTLHCCWQSIQPAEI